MIDLPALSFVLPIILLCAVCILALVAMVLTDARREQLRSPSLAVVAPAAKMAANDPSLAQTPPRYVRIRRFGRAAASVCGKSSLQMR